MDNTELLKAFKADQGIGGTYHDTKIQLYIDEVKEYLLDAGVNSTVIESECAKGVILRGMSDLWNSGAGDVKFSTYFMQRATQLSYKTVEETEEGTVEVSDGE